MTRASRKQENKVKEQYDRLAGRYDRRWKGYIGATHAFLERQISLTGLKAILNVACGTGALEKRLAAGHPNRTIVGADISEAMLTEAQRKLRAYPNVGFSQADASRLPFQHQSFDLVVCANSFHYFEDPRSVLAEFRRVLKPGGRIVILDWCKDYLICRFCDVLLKAFDPAYRQCYDQRELRQFLEAIEFRVLTEAKFRTHWIWGMMFAEASSCTSA